LKTCPADRPKPEPTILLHCYSHPLTNCPAPHHSRRLRHRGRRARHQSDGPLRQWVRVCRSPADPKANVKR
jgi:hypothetical protein